MVSQSDIDVCNFEAEISRSLRSLEMTVSKSTGLTTSFAPSGETEEGALRVQPPNGKLNLESLTGASLPLGQYSLK